MGFETIYESVSIKDLENKYVFWDIDGTLAPYRFNNHVADPTGTNNGMSLKEIEDGKGIPMQNAVAEIEAKYKFNK